MGGMGWTEMFKCKPYRVAHYFGQKKEKPIDILEFCYAAKSYGGLKLICILHINMAAKTSVFRNTLV